MPRPAAGIPTSIDPGSILIEQHRYDLEALYPYTDVLFLNQVELRALTDADYEEKCIDELLQKGVQNVVIKSGEKGSTLWRAHQPMIACPAFQINALDTTGAGDAFNAGFLYAIIQNYSSVEILKFANAVGAMQPVRLRNHRCAPIIPKVSTLFKYTGENQFEMRLKYGKPV
jgi:sugar/nucleoside kinase (ribokinase family)